LNKKNIDLAKSPFTVVDGDLFFCFLKKVPYTINDMKNTQVAQKTEKYFLKPSFLTFFRILLENVSHFTLKDVTYIVSLLFFCPSPFSFTKFSFSLSCLYFLLPCS